METKKARTHNREFAAMLADEYILIFISLSAHIQPTEFYQLFLPLLVFPLLIKETMINKSTPPSFSVITNEVFTSTKHKKQ
jgi:hypothetical protein